MPTPPPQEGVNQELADCRRSRFISYSRRRSFYTESQRYYRSTYSFRGIIPAVDQLAAEGLIEHEKVPPGHRGFQSRFRVAPDLLKELSAVEVQ